MAILSPIFLSTIFTLFHWWKIESKSLKQLMSTLPLVICQFWPQYRAIRMLYLGLWKQDSTWEYEHHILKRDIISLGKLLES